MARHGRGAADSEASANANGVLERISARARTRTGIRSARQGLGGGGKHKDEHEAKPLPHVQNFATIIISLLF